MIGTLPSLSALAVLATACLSSGSQAANPRLVEKRQQATGYNQPAKWLTVIPDSNLGEPLNVVISSASSPEVLTEDGLASYLSSLYFSPNSCLGLSLGDQQGADLNDGQGVVNQTELYRYNFNMGTTTCQESINGGQHIRYWKQSTTGAIFMAASVEMGASKNHLIVDNGYDLGRNWLVGNATNSSGTTSPQDKSEYKTTSTSVQASIDASSVNHGISTDGNVAVLTVTRTQAGNGTNPTASASSSKSTGSSSSAHVDDMHSSSWILLACMAMCTMLVTTPSVMALPRSESPRRRSSDPAVAEGQKLSGSTQADPLPKDSTLFSRAPTSPIDDALRARINAVSPFAQAPYCHSVQNGTWGGKGCGDACASVPGQVDIVWKAGDGDFNPHRLLLYVHQTKTLVLAVEGSNLQKLLSILDDVVFLPLPAAPSITSAFFKYNSGNTMKQEDGKLHVGGLLNGFATVHGNFLATWARLYPEALSQIKAAMKKYQVTNIISTGHSLGAAIATLDALALSNDLNGALPIEHIGYGSPRVFNPIGAALLDAVVSNPKAKLSYHHVHHDKDPVPHLAPLILNFQHSSNEVFLPGDAQEALNCPDRENLNCSLGRTTLDFNDHKGPYLNRQLGRVDEGPNSDCYLTAR
ncbi:unnamed protein product [Sympodiomycopsis kandeliae]